MKISEDIILEMKKKFPTSDIENIIPYLFQTIMQKTLRDGACNIREFGKFIAFATLSSRTNQKTIRFKFRISSSLLKKFNQDQYVLNNIPIQSKLEFNDKHEEKCKNKRDIRDKNIQAKNEAEKISIQKTMQNINKYNILNILSEDSKQE